MTIKNDRQSLICKDLLAQNSSNLIRGLLLRPHFSRTMNRETVHHQIRCFRLEGLESDPAISGEPKPMAVQWLQKSFKSIEESRVSRSGVQTIWTLTWRLWFRPSAQVRTEPHCGTPPGSPHTVESVLRSPIASPAT